MDNKKSPAYPQSCDANGHGANMFEGLSKLEDFTKAAMEGLCANQYFIKEIMLDPNIATGFDAKKIAQAAIYIAQTTLSGLNGE